MSNGSTDSPAPRFARFRNWVSLAGFITMLASLFAFLLLFTFDLVRPASNPYVGILTYLVAPTFTTIGLCLVVLGVLLRRRSLPPGSPVGRLVIDLSRKQDRRILGYFGGGGVLFLLITAVGSYHSYQFTESVTFCGQACHTVMEPEMVTYQHSPHARVACVECHIGPGAEWFVKAKLSGLYQVYATAANKYPRPIPTPIENLRPARDTCEHCHWPEKFSGNIVHTRTHYLSDSANTEYSVSLMLRVGGGNPSRDRVGGIHWHIANKVDYLPTDHTRQKIPWVRLTDANGVVTEYRTPSFTNQVDPAAIRRMDCMDCHNRPAHVYEKPNEAVDLAISRGLIDRSLPSVRSNATMLLTQAYGTVDEALAKIAEGMTSRYPNEPRSQPAIQALHEIYRHNFFPLMKASWRDYPENIGHKDWPGCVRCHDDKHASADGQRVIGFKNCNSCHLILSQGTADQLNQPSLTGQEFNHPLDPYEPEFMCNDCHTGGPE